MSYRANSVDCPNAGLCYTSWQKSKKFYFRFLVSCVLLDVWHSLMVAVIVKRNTKSSFFLKIAMFYIFKTNSIKTSAKILLFPLKRHKELMSSFSCVLKELKTRMSFTNGKDSKQEERNKSEPKKA